MVFRGTEGSEDIWADLKAEQVEIRPEARPGDPDPYAGIGKRKVKIHAGFRDQFLAVSTALTRNVEVREPSQPIHTCLWLSCLDGLSALVGKKRLEDYIHAGFREPWQFQRPYSGM